MRAVFGFFSMLALGLMIAAIIMLSATGGAPNAPGHLPLSGPYVDYMSVVIGLGVGLVIAIIAQVPWSELPQRLIHGIIAHSRKLKLLGWGALFAAVLFYF